MIKPLRIGAWTLSVLLALALSLPLTGCGQKGPLYLPQPKPPADQHKDAS